ncbi:MAG: hypothetical protein NUV59_03950 [Patescibacteria group bacterium]|nr:hypothetical protein [Patescibacteria group bacterium]
MRFYSYSVAGLLLLAPILAFAAGVPAGFAPGGVWLSKTSLTAGDTVRIYTVVYDSTDSPIGGSVSFLVDGDTIATQSFELGAGETKIKSAEWKASAGTHEISASLSDVIDKDTGEALPLEKTTAGSVSITVIEPPPPPVVAQVVASASEIVKASAPAVIQASGKAFDSLEYFRESAVRVLESQLAASGAASGVSSPATSDSQVLGTSTENLAAVSGSESYGAFGSLWRKILSGLLFISRTTYLFYAALLIVAYIFYKLIRVMLRERRHSYRD